jgi:hypothetical protein
MTEQDGFILFILAIFGVGPLVLFIGRRLERKWALEDARSEGAKAAEPEQFTHQTLDHEGKPTGAHLGGWHAPGLGEVHNRDHSLIIYCSRQDGDFEIADDALAERVCAALSASRKPQAPGEGN